MTAHTLCIIEGCEKPRGRSNGMCDMHYTRERRHGSPHVVRNTSEFRSRREEHPGWLGDDANYSTAHARVHRERGSATKHPCVDCGGPAQQWAYNNRSDRELVSPRGMRYSPDPADYEPRCCSCHVLFDVAHRPVTPAGPGQRQCVDEGCVAASELGRRGYCGTHYRHLRQAGTFGLRSGSDVLPYLNALLDQGWTLRALERAGICSRQRLARIHRGEALAVRQSTIDALRTLLQEAL